MVDPFVPDGRVFELDFQREDEAPVGASLARVLVHGPGVFRLKLVEQPVAQERSAKAEVQKNLPGFRIRACHTECAQLAADRGPAIELAEADRSRTPVDAVGGLRNRTASGQADQSQAIAQPLPFGAPLGFLSVANGASVEHVLRGSVDNEILRWTMTGIR